MLWVGKTKGSNVGNQNISSNTDLILFVVFSFWISFGKTGWLARIKLTNQGEFEALLNEAAYTAHCSGEAETS